MSRSILPAVMTHMADAGRTRTSRRPGARVPAGHSARAAAAARAARRLALRRGAPATAKPAARPA